METASIKAVFQLNEGDTLQMFIRHEEVKEESTGEMVLDMKEVGEAYIILRGKATLRWLEGQIQRSLKQFEEE